MNHFRAYQAEGRHSYAFGVFPTLELIAARPEQVVEAVFSSRAGRNAGVQKIRGWCAGHGVPVRVDHGSIERLSAKGSHLAMAVFEKYAMKISADRCHLVLVNPGDRGNLGTITRAMVGFGVTDLALIRPAVDIFDPRTVRASMGAVFRLAVEYFASFDEYRKRFGHHLYPLMTGGSANIAEVPFDPPFSLVLGNESRGLPSRFRELGTSVTIPQRGPIDSLNVAVAAAIALFESTEGQRCRGLGWHGSPMLKKNGTTAEMA